MTRRGYMLHPRLVWIALLVALAAWASAPDIASAQEKGTVELGMDGFIGIRTYASGSDVFSVDLPISSVRAGFYLSDRTALEPSLGFDVISGSGYTLSQLDFDLAMVFCMDDLGQTTPYFRVGGGVLLLNVEGSGDTQFTAGIAGGVRIPTGERMAVRLQLGIDRNFEGDFSGSTDIGLKAGLSFFTR
jgi:hypothetical protein